MKTTTANSTLAIGGVPSPLDSFVVQQSSVLRIKFSTEKPAHRQSAKRQAVKKLKLNPLRIAYMKISLVGGYTNKQID